MTILLHLKCVTSLGAIAKLTLTLKPYRSLPGGNFCDIAASLIFKNSY